MGKQITKNSGGYRTMNEILKELEKNIIVPVVVLQKTLKTLQKHWCRADFHVQRLHSVLTQLRNPSVSCARNSRKCA